MSAPGCVELHQNPGMAAQYLYNKGWTCVSTVNNLRLCFLQCKNCCYQYQPWLPSLKFASVRTRTPLSSLISTPWTVMHKSDVQSTAAHVLWAAAILKALRLAGAILFFPLSCSPVDTVSGGCCCCPPLSRLLSAVHRFTENNLFLIHAITPEI